jgi:hypothetical protein
MGWMEKHGQIKSRSNCGKVTLAKERNYLK